MLGIGIDIVETARIQRLLEKYGERFTRQFLAPNEQLLLKPNTAEQAPRRWLTFVAGRWAAKEAVMKVLGAGLGTLDMREIEILRAESGGSYVNLTGQAHEIAIRRSISNWQMSISHERLVTVAVAVAL